MEKTTVFISFKNSDDGKRTEDARISDALYASLSKAGVNTFYSNITLIEKGSSIYKETIEQALEEAVVLIVIGTKIGYIESEWVKYEWSSFHQDMLGGAKPNGVIVPYISENISVNEKPRPLRYIETFFIEKDPVEKLTEFVINYLKSKNLLYEEAAPTIYEKGIGEHSHYKVISKDEREMVKIQSQLSLESDLAVMTDLLGSSGNDGKKYVLDVGCVEGITVKDRISRIDNMDICVVGVDRDNDVIKIANENNNDSRYTFVNIEVESDDFEEKMQEFMDREGIPGFDLITVTLLLRHFKEPALAIKRLKKFIRNQGYIYIREQDDRSLVSYGDKGLISKIVKKHRELPGVSDHYYGRKVYSQLVEAGYRNISSRSVVRDTVNKSEKERVDIFCAQFVKRKNFIDYLYSRDPSNVNLRETLDWFGVALDKLYEYFIQPDFFYSETDFIFWGQNL